jgi:hypothetical protein
MRRCEDGPSSRFERRTIREVSDIWYIWRLGVEAVLHVLLRELREGTSLKAKVLHNTVDTFDPTSWEWFSEFLPRMCP